ncbi:MAG: peptide ABC transporter substrate-binding protein [Candidatus Brocadiales bacterium]|nr:peptide ABC transporter substrate-binding protein [Candidatus Brocadiales bacterium]
MFKVFLPLILVPVIACTAITLTTHRCQRAEITYVSGPEPETLDPALLTGALEGRIVAALFEGLTQYHPKDLSPTPGIAREWRVSEDGLVYTFFLRESCWSNEEPLTAHDFVYSWKRTLLPETAADYAYQLYYIKNARAFNEGKIEDFSQVGVCALDDYTLEVELERPTAFFLDLTSFPTLLPVDRKCIERYGEDWTKPGNMVSNGPFRLVEWRINDKLRMVKNPYYWDADQVRLQSVAALSIESINTGFNLYETGGADYLFGLPLPIVQVLKGRNDFHTDIYLATYFYRFNVTRKPFDDPRVRKAFAMAIDKGEIVNYVTRGGEVPAKTLVPPGMPHYQPPLGVPFDPEEARRLLAEAGYPAGKGFPKVELLFNTSEANKDIAEVVQQMWKKHLGVEVTLVNQEWKVFLSTVKNLDYQIARGNWIGDYVDPNTFLDMFVTEGGNNRTGWSNPRYDHLIEMAASEIVTRKRMDIFQEAEKILVEDELPILPIYYHVSFNIYRPYVKGVYPNILNVHPWKYMWIEREES